MKSHTISFIRNPLGYLIHCLWSLLPYLPKILDELLEPPVNVLRDFFHSKDDPIQRDPLF